MDVRLPDGTIIRGVPDGMSKAELTNKLVANGYAKSLGGTDYSAQAPSPSFGGRVLEGVGQGMNTLLQGVQQRLGMASEADVAETRKTDAPLMATGGGLVGSVIGQAAPAVALSLVPGANTAIGATMLGAGMGALQPTVEGEDVATNAAKGGIFSLGGHLLGKAIFGPITNRNTAPKQELIDLAQQKYGITLPASVRTGNKPLAYVESQLAATPGGGRTADLLQRGNEEYAKAVMREAGAPGELATQSALNQAIKRSQDAYEAIWSQNVVKADGTLLNDLAQARALADRVLTPPKVRVVENQINNILSKIQPGDEIPGDVYQKFLRPEIRTAIKGDSSLTEPLRQVKKALDDAAMRSVGGSTADELLDLNYRYAVQKSLQPAMGVAESRGGTFSPSAVKVAAGNMRGNIGELAKIGPLLREPPQSGTVPRAMANYMLTGIPAAGAGAAYGYGEGGTQGAATGGILGLLAPALASRVLSNPATQNYLTRGMLNSGPRAQEIMGALLRAGVIPLPQLIDATQQ